MSSNVNKFRCQASKIKTTKKIWGMATDNSRLLELIIAISCLLILAGCFRSVQAQTVDTSGDFSHAHNTLLPVSPVNPAQNNPLSPPPPATYDEQLGMTFTQNFVSIAYNVTAIAQVDSYGYGPAYLLNGLSNDGYWYQVGLSYDWPHQSGGYSSGFNFNYEVFNSAGNSIYPTNGGGGLQSFSGTVNSGDLVLLNLYFNNGVVYMYAKDWNTSAVSYVTYADSQTNKFIGISSMGNSHGFFTGLMTEWYHVSQYSGDEYPVTYSDNTFGLSSAWIWMDEWQPPNGPTQFRSYVQVTYLSNPTQLQSFSSNGATEFSSSYEFITGSIGTQMTSIKLLPDGESTSLSVNNDNFIVSYTLGGQPQVAYAQDGTLTLFVDTGTNVVISGMSIGSSSTEEWVFNSQGTSVNIPAGSTTTLYYYDLLSQRVAYFAADANSISPILTYYTAPLTSSSQSNPTATAMFLPYFWQQTIMVLRGTMVSVSNNILGTAQDQWATPIASWSISQVNQISSDIFYYHQYQVTAGYSTSDNSVPSTAPLLSGTQFGSNYQLPLTTTNQTTWLDANTPWSTPTIATAISGTEQWSSSAGTSGNITGSITINPIYVHQYYLAVISTYSSPSGSGWYNSGSNAQATISPLAVSGGTGTQYVFAGWTGDATGSGSPSNNINMNAPKTATATWTTQYYLTVSSGYSTPSGAGWYNSGATAYAGVSSNIVSGGTSTQYVLSGWTGDASGSGSTSNGITMNAPKTATASWGTQYYLTVTSPYGSPSTASGWFNAGTNINEAVTSSVPVATGTQYVCTGWTGTGSITSSGNTPSTAFTIDAPTTVNWNWEKQYYLNMTTNFGSATPGSCWQDAGTTVTISATAPAVQNGERYVWNGWSGLSNSVDADNSFSVTINEPLTAVASWVHQYMVTVNSPYGSPSPLTGWFNAGADITFSVSSPAPESIISQHVCTGWTGTGSAPATGTTTSLHFTINQPSSITWNWQSKFILPMVLLMAGVPSATVIIGLSIYLLRHRQMFKKRK